MRALLSLALVCSLACDETPEDAAPDLEGVPAEAPFAVEDPGALVLSYVDADGVHAAGSIDEVPPAARGKVRIDSLALPPEAREADVVYVADVSSGDVRDVRRLDRVAFDLWVAQVTGERPSGDGDAPTALADASVIIYGAEWCSACRSAARYLSAKGVPFVEKDIEADAGARAEMSDKARAAGLAPSGIPVLDVRGRILTGFDPGSIDRALDSTSGRTL
ncbi:MAG: glutaredoxin domain-containing protein [Myxococcota bacterium]